MFSAYCPIVQRNQHRFLFGHTKISTHNSSPATHYNRTRNITPHTQIFLYSPAPPTCCWHFHHIKNMIIHIMLLSIYVETRLLGAAALQFYFSCSLSLCLYRNVVTYFPLKSWPASYIEYNKVERNIHCDECVWVSFATILFSQLHYRDNLLILPKQKHVLGNWPPITTTHNTLTYTGREQMRTFYTMKYSSRLKIFPHSSCWVRKKLKGIISSWLYNL